MGTANVTLDWKSGMAFDVDIEGHIVRMDRDEAGGGENTGPTPKPLMLAALAGCTAIDVVSLLQKMRVPFDDLKIDVSATVTEEHPKIYDTVHLVYMIYGKDVDHDKMQKAVELSQEKYCGVSAMFRHFAKVTYEIEYF
jgi:putative redox protein